MGMAHVPEGRRVFAQLSVYDNLMMGAYTRKDKSEIKENLHMVYERFPRLEERKTQMAGTLSGGEQQMLAMGRALMSQPSIILMDEPSMGLSPIFVNEILLSGSASRARRYFWWNRMPRRRWRSRIGLMYWRPVRSLWREMPVN